jgi:phosphoglucosamine mutase
MAKDLKNVAVNEERKNKYFGTDGFRGEANVDLNSVNAYRIGRFLGWYALSQKKKGQRPRIVIGKDTRRSSYMLEYSIAAGICASGSDVYMLHVTTTPSVSYVTRKEEFDFGIMITASHNPYYDNGIKIINGAGEKLDGEIVFDIESYIDGEVSSLGICDADLPFAKREDIGAIFDFVAGRNRYLGYLISLASNSYRNLKIGIDCANGASWSIARAVFEALGAKITLIGTSPDGFNINENCGSTHIENLVKLVRDKKLDIGLAFDGDADRCIAVDENGKVVDGDAIMYILANRLKNKGKLNKNVLVNTVMSNSGVVDSLREIGIECVQTKVGDRFVYEAMQEGDYVIGGEHSGHIILKKYATTGDGIVTAIMLCEELCERKLPLSKLCEPIRFYPQKTVNIRNVNRRAVMTSDRVGELIHDMKKLIADKGRILLRESGTEPLVRLMVESESEELCEKICNKLEKLIKEVGKENV